MTTITLTDEHIDHLIGARNRITDVTADYPDFRAVDHIDAVLSVIPIGERPDVDALLGRTSKRVVMVQHIGGTVEKHPGWIASQEQRVADVQPLCDETIEKWHEYMAGLSDDEIALMQAMCNETAHDDAKDDATGRPW